MFPLSARIAGSDIRFREVALWSNLPSQWWAFPGDGDNGGSSCYAMPVVGLYRKIRKSLILPGSRSITVSGTSVGWGFRALCGSPRWSLVCDLGLISAEV